jgi:hypothetical protein
MVDQTLRMEVSWSRFEGAVVEYDGVIIRGAGGTFETLGRIAHSNQFRRQVQHQMGG